MTRIGTVALLKQAVEKEKETISRYAKDDNPQIVELRNRAKGRLEAFEAVLDSLRGSHVMLRIYAGENR